MQRQARPAAHSGTPHLHSLNKLAVQTCRVQSAGQAGRHAGRQEAPRFAGGAVMRVRPAVRRCGALAAARVRACRRGGGGGSAVAPSVMQRAVSASMASFGVDMPLSSRCAPTVFRTAFGPLPHLPAFMPTHACVPRQLIAQMLWQPIQQGQWQNRGTGAAHLPACCPAAAQRGVAIYFGCADPTPNPRHLPLMSSLAAYPGTKQTSPSRWATPGPARTSAPAPAARRRPSGEVGAMLRQQKPSMTFGCCFRCICMLHPPAPPCCPGVVVGRHTCSEPCRLQERLVHTRSS